MVAGRLQRRLEEVATMAAVLELGVKRLEARVAMAHAETVDGVRASSGSGRFGPISWLEVAAKRWLATLGM